MEKWGNIGIKKGTNKDGTEKLGTQKAEMLIEKCNFKGQI